MLRTIPGHQVPPAAIALRSRAPFPAPPIDVRPRAVKPAPVFPPPSPRAIAVRGHVSNGSAAALILDPTGVCLVSADRSGRRRVRRFTLPEILAVEERRLTRSSELTVLTASTSICVVDVDIAQAWSFVRELREAILKGSL